MLDSVSKTIGGFWNRRNKRKKPIAITEYNAVFRQTPACGGAQQFIAMLWQTKFLGDVVMREEFPMLNHFSARASPVTCTGKSDWAAYQAKIEWHTFTHHTLEERIHLVSSLRMHVSFFITQQVRHVRNQLELRSLEESKAANELWRVPSQIDGVKARAPKDSYALVNPALPSYGILHAKPSPAYYSFWLWNRYMGEDLIKYGHKDGKLSVYVSRFREHHRQVIARPWRLAGLLSRTCLVC